MNKHEIDEDLINNFKDVNNEKVWEDIWQKLCDKYNVKKQQQKIYKQSVAIFYPQNEKKEVDDEEDDQQNKNNEDTDLLK